MSLRLHTCIEAQISHLDNDPADQTGHGGDVHKPGEHSRRATSQRHVSQRHQNAGHADSKVRRAEAIAFLEESRGMAIAAEAVQCSRRNEDTSRGAANG